MAGLSLAVRLTEGRFAHLRIVVIEPRTHYSRDRTWCYWSVPKITHPFAEAVTMRWPKWRLSRWIEGQRTHTDGSALIDVTCNGNRRDGGNGGGDRGDRSGSSPDEDIQYEMIQADTFYATALKAISAASHITLRLGATVESLQTLPDDSGKNSAGKVAIKTNLGVIHGGLIFDSRPPSMLSKAAWIQGFRGIEVETDKPCFDPKTVTMMDFSIAPNPATTGTTPTNQVRFMYVLPFSTTHALIEETTFTLATDSSRQPVFDESAAQHYLTQKFGANNVRILHREQGAIPMDPALRPSHAPGKVIKIGTAGGMCRASSGYTFFETQRACKMIADRLATMGSQDFANVSPQFALPKWRSSASYWMDAVFLRVLATEPGIAPILFTNLFANVPADALVRFLSGVATPIDLFHVVTACPKWPFIKAVVS